MSRTTFILIGITYYIISVIAIIVVLNILSKKERKKYENAISNLERDKNLIISASILSELNKVEPLVTNSDSKDVYEGWQRRFKQIKDVEVPKITDALLEIEELFNARNYKELRKKIAEVEIDICYVKTKSNFLLEEIKGITLSEERNRDTITKLKAHYSENLNIYNNKRNDNRITI